MFELALQFLSNPYRLWASDRLEDKRLALKLTFGERVTYIRNCGFRTPVLSSVFKALEDLTMGKKDMAELEGESLNSIFETLAEWEEQLKYAEPPQNDEMGGPKL